MTSQPTHIPAGAMGRAIQRASHQLGAYLDRETDGLAITQSEAHVLARLGAARHVSINDLHRDLAIKRSTLTSVLRRLEEGGYTVGHADPVDRRSTLLRLTPKGKRAAARVLRIYAAIETRVLKRVRTADLASLHVVLDAVQAATRQQRR